MRSFKTLFIAGQLSLLPFLNSATPAFSLSQFLSLGACALNLVSTTLPPDVSALVHDFQNELSAPTAKDTSEKLRLLRSFVQNKELMMALRHKDPKAEMLLKKLTINHGDSVFSTEAVHLLSPFHESFVVEIRDRLKNETPPQDLLNKDDFPSELFSKSENLQTSTKDQIIRFFNSHKFFPSKFVTRRILAFLVANPSLTAQEKINFCKNMSQSFREFQLSQGVFPSETLVFEDRGIVNPQGDYLFCGHRCSFYYVITQDGTFYSAQSLKDVKAESTKEVLANWRDASRYIFEAGNPIPIKEVALPSN